MICFSFVACGCRDLSCTADTTDMVAIGHEEREREKERRERERGGREREKREREKRDSQTGSELVYILYYICLIIRRYQEKYGHFSIQKCSLYKTILVVESR
jgi:hypothetical protein